MSNAISHTYPTWSEIRVRILAPDNKRSQDGHSGHAGIHGGSICSVFHSSDVRLRWAIWQARRTKSVPDRSNRHAAISRPSLAVTVRPSASNARLATASRLLATRGAPISLVLSTSHISTFLVLPDAATRRLSGLNAILVIGVVWPRYVREAGAAPEATDHISKVPSEPPEPSMVESGLKASALVCALVDG